MRKYACKSKSAEADSYFFTKPSSCLCLLLMMKLLTPPVVLLFVENRHWITPVSDFDLTYPINRYFDKSVHPT